jgi:protein SCO1/2
MNLRRPLTLVILIGVVAATAGALLARMLSQSPVPLAGGTWLPEPRQIAPFVLQDLSGKAFDNAALRGRPHLLFFGFTYCPDVCPTTLATLREVYQARGDGDLADLRVLFVSIDPERDSAANLRQYLNAFSHDFEGLRTDEPNAIKPLLASLGAIAVRETLPDGSYTMDHTAAVYLLDRRGRYRAVFTPPFTAARLNADLQRVAAARRL